MSSTLNPYAAPAARVDDVAANPQAEAIRRAHIGHETSIRAVGLLYYLGGVLGLVGAITPVLVGVSMEFPGAIPALLLAAFSVGTLFAGWGVRALRPWGKIVGCVLSAIGLIGFPVGTLINAYILYLFLSKKGRTIFAPGYQDIIAATPHVKYRTSIIVWIFVALIVILLLAAVLVPMVGR
jgi:hypothetical protein